VWASAFCERTIRKLRCPFVANQLKGGHEAGAHTHSIRLQQRDPPNAIFSVFTRPHAGAKAVQRAQLDGYYAWDEELARPLFHATAPPTTADVERLVKTVQRRVERALVHRGLYEVIEEEPEQDALFALQAASAANRVAMGVRAGRKVRKLQLGSTRERKLPPLCAEAGYFNLHAGVRVRAQDRAALERLCRYVARPPLSHARLKRHDDGDIALALKTPWSDGTSHVLLSELELVEKLAALVPTPNANLVTYTGVLAPAAKWRSLVVPAHERCSARGCQHGAAAAHASWIPWSDLLKRTFGVDALACACGGRLKVRAVVRGSWNAPKLLGVVGHPAAQTAWVAARAPPRDEVWC